MRGLLASLRLWDCAPVCFFFVMVLVLCIVGVRLEGCVGELQAFWYGIPS